MTASTQRLAIGALLVAFGLACSAPAAPSAPTPAPTQVLQPTAAPTVAPTAAPTAAATTAAPVAQPTATASKPLTKITVSYSERVGSYLPLVLAADQGIFAKHGLDPELQLMAGATGMAALISGQVQIAQVGGSEVLSAEASGSDLVMSGNLGAVSSYVFLANSEVQTVDDLKGKKIGISSVGGSADTATRLSMQHYGLDPDKDISIIPLGSLQNRTAGLMNGAIQAAPSNPPESLLLQRQGFHVLFKVADLGLPMANATIVAQRSWINANREVFQAWNDSIVEAITLARARPDIGLPVMKQFIQNDDDELMRPTYDFWMNTVIKQPPVLTPDQFTAAIGSLAPNNPKVNDIDINRMIDTSFVQNAVDKGLAGNP